MGGDFGPPNLVGGAVLALRESPQIDKLFLVGDTAQIEAELKKNQCNDRRVEIVHSTQVVAMTDGAVESVRRKKDSSVSRAVDLVKKGEAAAIVSAGHTGAAVAATTIKLRTLPGIDRPGIAAIFPSETNIFVLIDAGANSDARPEHLLQYGIMLQYEPHPFDIFRRVAPITFRIKVAEEKLDRKSTRLNSSH